jgi:type II secretory pathway pseudopilin PulG
MSKSVAVTRILTCALAQNILMSGILAVLLLPIAAGSASAQDIRQVQNALQSTTNSIEAVKTALGAIIPPDQSKVRFTPGLFVDPTVGQGLLFSVINVSSVARMIKLERVDPVGNIRVIISGTVLQPNHSTSGNVGLVPFSGPYVLKFTVLDGSRTDIRGSAQQLLGVNVLGAVLAAE